MFCSKCGSMIIDGAKFCSNCGSEVAQFSPKKESSTYVADEYGLPAGMTRTADGKICFRFMEKKSETICYLDDEKITVLHEIKHKKRSALGEFLLNTAELIAMESDSYDPFIPLPSELEGDETGSSVKIDGKEYSVFHLRFSYISAIKEDRKNGVITVFALSTRWPLYLTPEQYDFTLNHILTHKPNVRRK